MAGVRFPYTKRQPVTVDKDGQPLDDAAPQTASPISAYPTIDPNPVPPIGTPSVAAPAVTPDTPVIDPTLLTRPRTVTSQPVVSQSGQVMNEDSTRLRRVETDKNSRPIANPTIADRDARLNDLADRVDDYVPQKAPKWQRYLKIAAGVGAMFAGAAGHDSRAVAGATHATIANAVDPKLADEMWKRGQQEQVGEQIDSGLKQKKTQAEIADISARPELRRQAAEQKQIGLDLRGQRVGDQKLSEGMSRYNQLKDYDPNDPKYAGLKKIFEENYGLRNLPVKNDDKFDIKVVNGQYEWIPKKPGDVVDVNKPGGGGAPLVDPGKVADQTVTIGNQTFTNLTPREAATLRGRAYEGQQNRESRETIAANAQTGATERAGMTGGMRAGAVNPSVKGSIAALSKFRALSAKIESTKTYYGLKDDSPPTADGQSVIKSLYDQRDGLERDMKQLYGQFIELDDKGKPSGLKENIPVSGGQNFDIGPAIERFKVRHHRSPSATEISNMQKAIDALK